MSKHLFELIIKNIRFAFQLEFIYFLLKSKSFDTKSIKPILRSTFFLN